MHFSIAIFSRQDGHRVTLTTLGLGPKTQTRHGRHLPKVRTDLLADVHKEIEKMPVTRLERVTAPRGIRLERVRMTLTLTSDAGRRKVSGVYPIILTPFTATRESRIWVAYHPDRQEQLWPVEPQLPLEDQLRPYFSRVWENLADDVLEELLSRGKERVDVLGLSAEPLSVFEALPEKARDGRELIGAGDPAHQVRKKRVGLKTLRDLATDLRRQAASGDWEGGLPRSPYREEIQRLFGVTDRAKAGGGQGLFGLSDAAAGKSFVLIGPPGCGKTTLLQRGILDLLEADGYRVHRDVDRVRPVFSLRGSRIIAGMSHLGAWEKRVVSILEEARAHQAVLVVDDLHHFGRIGRSRESDRALADLFRGPLARGEVLMVGETTPAEFLHLEQESPSFAALFTKVHVSPTSREETLRLLLERMRRIEQTALSESNSTARLEVTPHALRTVLDVSTSLLSARALPGSALELLDELGRSATNGVDSPEPLGSRTVFALVAKKTGVPEMLLSPEKKLTAATVEEALSRQVMGQPEAVRAAANLVLRVKTGLTDPRRPYGVLLFTGPTGTGKTELAKALAQTLYGHERRLIRFDMSEFNGPDAVPRLIGSAYDPDGHLTRRVREQPFSLVLLDEIEKAHPSVLGLLLQLFEDGRLTNAGGQATHFEHTVVVMTSNLGARPRAAVGFGESGDAVLHDIAREVRAYFAPELFNRIDRVVPFRPLTPEIAEKVAAKELDKLCRRRGLVERGVLVHVGPGVVSHIARAAFASDAGARSVKRYLEDTVAHAFTEAIAGEKPAALVRLHLTVHNDALTVRRESLEEAEPMAAIWQLEPLIDAPMAALRKKLPDLLRLTTEVTEGEEFSRLSADIQEHLEGKIHSGTGQLDPATAEAIYHLDEMRAALVQYKAQIEEILRNEGGDTESEHDQLELRRFQWTFVQERDGGVVRHRLLHPSQMPPTPKRVLRHQVLEAIAEGYALRRALMRARHAGDHAVIVDIASAADLDDPQLALSGREGYVEVLARMYAAARGQVESFVVLRKGTGPATSETQTLSDALSPLENRVIDRVLLKIVGLSVREFFEPEAGAHVWNSLERAPQVAHVRVGAVLPGEHGIGPLLERARKPLDLGEKLRVVRTITSRGAAGAARSIDIEDHVMGFADTVEVHTPEDWLVPIWLLRLSREDMGGAS